MGFVSDFLREFRAPDKETFDALPGSDGLDELYHLTRDPTGFFHERFEKHGRVFKSRLVVPCVFVSGDEALKTVLVTRRADMSQGRGYAKTAVKLVFENSIMLQDGEDHARTRGILSPAVSRLSVRDSAERVFDIWSGAVRGAANKPSVDIYTLAQRTTYDVAVNALVRLELGPASEALRPHFETLMEGILAPVNVRVPYSRLDRALHARDRLEEMLREPIEAARRIPPNGLLGQLAHHRDPDGTQLSTKEIAHHLLLLAWAGYDTTASAASWILWVLAQRPDWQERLRSLVSLLDGDIAAIDSDKRLAPLEWFLLEIERMYPSALFFPRVALADVELHGHRIPKETLIFYSPYLSHRDPQTFEHPNAFDPDRWDPARGASRPSPSKLYGFGGGARVCLGKAFARLQLKLMIRALLENYRIEPDPRHPGKVMGIPVHHPIDSKIRIRPLESKVVSTDTRVELT